MAVLSATFELIDKMSDKFDKMASSGENAMQKWENAGDIGSNSFEGVAHTATQTAKAMDTASEATDFWTDKIGNYDKGAMEAIYSTEELVEMGYKTADALDEEAQAADEAAKGTGELGDEFDKTSQSSKKYSDSTEDAASATEALGDILTTLGIAKLLGEIASAAAECVEQFQEYQTSIAKVDTLADTSVKSIGDISSEILGLSGDVGQASGDLAEATYQAISAGVNTASSVDFVRQSNELAVGGFTEATTAVDVLTTALNAYGLEVSNASQISDYLITTQNLGKTTVNELSASVGKVIPLAAAYGVEMDNLSTAYAVMTANGIATAETGTYLKAMLNELGDSGSAVAETLLNQTGQSFAQLSAQGYSLGDIMSVLGESVNGDATAFAELWSSSEAGVGALSLMNSGAERYNSVLNSMQNSAGATSTAFEKMASTSAFAEQKMKNSAKNMQIAIGEDLAGSLSGLYSIGSSIMGGITWVVQKCPAVTAVIVGAAGALTTLTVGVTAYTLYTKYATVVTAAFTTALETNPYILAATAIIGVTSALVVLISNMDTATSEYNSLTAASQKQYDEIESLNEKYQEACDAYGDQSQQAKELEGELIMLKKEYENTKQTVEEFENSLQATSDSIADTASAYDEAIGKIDKEHSSVTALIARLEQLTSADDSTAASQAEILGIVEELNNQFPELNLNYEDVINNTQATVESLEQMAMAEYKTEKSKEAWDAYKKSMGDITSAQDNVTNATKNQSAAQEKLNALMESADYKAMQEAAKNLEPSEAAGRAFASTYQDIATQVNQAQQDVSYWDEALEKANGTLDEAKTKSEEYLNTYLEASGVSVAAKEATDEASAAIENAAFQVQQLAAEYQKAYDAAYESFSGQFGLFDVAKADMESTVTAAQNALNSQLAYWENYASNISTLKGISAEDLGVTQENYNALMSYVQSGTEEAAGLAQSMVNTINSGNQEAISKLASTIGEVKSKQEQAASEVAQWQTDFDNRMNTIVQKMQTTMGDLDLSDEATAAATSTMTSYASEITKSGSKAVTAAQDIAAKVKAALQSASTNINIGTSGGVGKGYASGTDNATPGWHMVGENGPEIMEFKGGETVYDAEETEKMLSTTRPTPLHTNVPESETGQKTESVSSKEKRIVISIEGGGEIKIPAGVDKETVLSLLTANLKPTLLNILQEEMFEEGEGSYAY